MSDIKTKMRVQKANVRIKNFMEVELGFNDEEAKIEANRCLHCPNPRCVKGCPVGIMIPEFIKCVKDNDMKGAYEVISKSSTLPSICGRVCPQEKQCESMCVKGFKGDAIAIGSLERYVADFAREHHFKDNVKVKKNGKKVAVIGSGPAGLACAGDLIKNGYEVTIYEVLHKPGGVLTYGIPEFRLPKKIVEEEITKLEKLGVQILCDVPIGKSLTISDLQKQYDYIFLGTGAGLPKFMNIPGEDANEVFAANEVLTRINLMKAYADSKTPVKKGKIAYVIGGGNVAMDAARSLRRLGMEVHLMYRRSMEELPARKMEVEHAKEEGIIFNLLENPVEILTDSDNHVIGMNVISMELGEPDASGRRSVSEKAGSSHTIKCDMVIEALGTSPNHLVFNDSDIKLDEKGLVITENSLTSAKNVYAGGDIVTGAATVIKAMEAGRSAAKRIMEESL